MRAIIKECRAIVKKYEAKVVFKRLRKDISGYCEYEHGLITLATTETNRAVTLSTLFHEIFHLVCYRKGLWRNFHESEDRTTVLKTALKAERYIDKLAQITLYNYDKRLTYIHSYSGPNKELKKFLEEFYDKQNR